jgi:tRNA(Arg) A34 adenosine deaminase TadA
VDTESSITRIDLALLRRAIDLAALARAHGNHPFGALLADAEGHILAEAENTVTTDRDVTGHAETNLVRIASRTLPARVLPRRPCTPAPSRAPCARARSTGRALRGWCSACPKPGWPR